MESNYHEGGGLKGGIQWSEGGKGGQIRTANGKIEQGMHPAFVNRVGDDGKPWPDFAIRHATMVRRIGDALVDTTQLLKDLGIGENTLIVFTSDNGATNARANKADYFYTFGPYDWFKRDMWEGCVSIPPFLSLTSVVAFRTKSHHPSPSHVLLPTFCALSGLPPHHPVPRAV